MTENIYIDFATLKTLMRDIFIGAGVPPADAEICADVLICADRLGIDSHGVGRLKPIYIDRLRAGIQQPVTRIEYLRTTPTTAVIDGHDGMGMVIAREAMQCAIDKAREYGMGMTAVRNSTHFGIAGYYGLMAAENGMVGIIGTNARPSTAPTFGVDNMLGTNPLTFVMPTDEEFPFFLDCATSVSQRGKIEVYDRMNKDIPHGWVIDVNGNDRTDTHQILEDLLHGQAALAPLGGIGEEHAGYKGYGYATVVEILSAALQQGNFLRALSGFSASGEKQPYRLGHFFIAINVEAFSGLEEFKRTTGEILRALRASRKAPGHGRIYTAGEKEYLTQCERAGTGVPIPPPLQKILVELCRDYQLTAYQKLFA